MEMQSEIQSEKCKTERKWIVDQTCELLMLR